MIVAGAVGYTCADAAAEKSLPIGVNGREWQLKKTFQAPVSYSSYITGTRPHQL